MTMGPILTTTAGLLAATAFGSMIFFAAVMAPLIFTRLPEEVSGPFIRTVFPRYYAVLAIATGLAAVAAAPEEPTAALLLAGVCAGFVYARQRLMPRVNELRDRELAGDETASPAFRRTHRASVVINALQMLALLLLLIRWLP